MATDTTNFTPDMNSTDNESSFDAVQLAQAGSAAEPVQVVIPAGAKVVRVPVTAGEVIELPFGADVELAGKLGDNGNLAIKVGDITVILEGYTAAEGQQPVVIETADGKPIVLADVLSAGEGLDIQTAAGGDAAGAQGADNTGAIFEAFGAGQGLGGFGAIGAQDQTALNYKLIDADQKLFVEDDRAPGENDTHPTPTNECGEVDEDGRKHLSDNPFDDKHGGLNTDPTQPGDDDRSFKTVIHIVDFGPDGFGSLVGDPGDGHCYDKDGLQVYSHGEEVLLRWNETDPAHPFLEGYVEGGNVEDTCDDRTVFTVTLKDGGVNGDVCFTLKGPLDHPLNQEPCDGGEGTPTARSLADGAEGGDGDGCCDPYAKWTEFEDNIHLALLFQAKDGDDTSATPIPVCVDVDDDSPAFLDCGYDPCVGITIVNDETHGVQCGTDDVDVTLCFLTAIAGEQIEPGEHTILDKFIQFFGGAALHDIDPSDITAAQKQVKFGYGADGPLVHEVCCDGGEGGGEVPSVASIQNQGYGYGSLHGGDCVINCGALLTNSCGDVKFCEDTGLTITVGDCDNTQSLHVYMEGLGNTIFGYAEDKSQGGEGGNGGKIPVFIITINPDTGELTYVQFHQINHDDSHDPYETVDGSAPCSTIEQLHLGIAITDFDHDSIWSKLTVTVEDDGPKVNCVTYVSECDGGEGAGRIYTHDQGYVDEDWVKHGNQDQGSNPGDDIGSNRVGGIIDVDFGADHPGKFSLNGLVVKDDNGCTVYDTCGVHNLFTADHQQVCVEQCGPGEIVGKAGDTVVFTLTLDECTGEFRFTQYQALSHPLTNDGDWCDGKETAWEDNLHFSFGVKATDCDGDSVCTAININVDDDSPVICDVCYFSEDTGYQDEQPALVARGGTFVSCDYGSVDEDWLANGNHDKDTNPDNNNSPFGTDPENHGDANGGLCVLGQIHASVGADRPGAFTFNVQGLCESGDTAASCYKTAGGEPITLVLCHEGSNWVIKGVYDTADGGEGGGQSEAFRVTLSGKTGEFKFELETALQHPDTNGVPNDDDNGKSSYEDDLLVSFGVKLTDADGDYVTTCLKFQVDDDAPVQCKPIDWTVDEDAVHPAEWSPEAPLAGSIPGGPGDSSTDWIGFTANLNVKFGADGPAANPYAFAGLEGDPVSGKDGNGAPIAQLTSGGVPVVYHWDAGTSTLTGVAGALTIFTAHVDQSNGDLTFQLTGPIDHPFNADGLKVEGPSAWEDDVSFDLRFLASDKDGDAVVAVATVRVDDDSPEAYGSGNCVVECCGCHGEDSFSVDASMITVTDQDGNPATLITNGNGFGVGSGTDGGDGGRFDEINYVGDGTIGSTDSEHLFADFGGKVASGADVDLSVFFGNEGSVGNEQGAYRLYLDGVAGEWHSFTANSGSGLFNFHIDPDAGTQGFDKIEFIAIPGSVDVDGNDAADSSDYSIQNVAVELKACAQTEGCVSWGFGADGPAAEGAVKLVAPTADVTSGGQSVLFTVSDDGATVYGKLADSTPVMELVLDPATGKYHFYLYEQIDHGAPGSDTDEHLNIPFHVQVTDADGDATTACINIDIKDTVPTANDDSNTADFDAQTQSFLATGNVMDNDEVCADKPGHISCVHLNGEEYEPDENGDIKVETDSFKLTVHADGSYEFEQTGAVSNDGQPVDKLHFEYCLSDADGDEDTASLCITLGSAPVDAVDDNQNVNEGGKNYNLLFIVDTSGSMAADPDGAGGFATRLDLIKASIGALLTSLDALPGTDVHVQFVEFGGLSSNPNNGNYDAAASHSSEFSSITDALNYLNALAIRSGNDQYTDYDHALEEAQTQTTVLNGSGVNQVFFLSDGEPNRPNSDAGINSSEESVWQDFLGTHNATAEAVGVGAGVSTGALAPIDSNDPVIIVDDGNDLLGSFSNALGSFITGNVLTGLNNNPAGGGIDDLGFPAAHITQIVDGDGTVFTAADPVGGQVLSNVGGKLMILTDLGATFTFDFNNGAYTYAANGVTKDETESFKYTIDNGFDDDTATLTINVKNIPEPPVATNDRIYTNISGVFSVSDALLTKNDSDPDTLNANLTIAAVIAAAGQATFFDSLAHAATQSNIDLDIGSGANALGNGETTSFDYTLKDDTGNADTGTVQITFDSNGSIDGSSGHDILIGKDVGLHGGNGDDDIIGVGAQDLLDYSDVGSNWNLTLGAGGSGVASIDGTDTYSGIDGIIGGSGKNTLTGNSDANLLHGGDGNDILNGGDGNDTLVGGSGNDALHGEGGNDWLHYDSSDSVVDGGTGRDVAILGTEGNFTYSDAKFDSVEAIDLVNTGTTDVTKMSLSAADVVDNNNESTTGFNFSGNEIGLFVLGDSTGSSRDTVDLTGAGWSKAGGAGSTVTTSVFSEDGASHTYDVWTNSSDPTHAIVAIQQGLVVA